MLKEVGLDDFERVYSSFPHELSGGQKQRISLARALIKKPKILLLDDCLSAVDISTEKEITNNLQIETGNITKIIVSQRISTIKECDKIMVLFNGEILQIGTHDELINDTNGYYHQIDLKQNKKNN